MTRTSALVLAIVTAKAATAHAIMIGPGWGKGYSKSSSFGDADWGAGYSTGVNVSYRSAFAGAPEHLSSSASLTVWGRMLGVTKTMAEASASGYASADGGRYGVDIYAAGLLIYSHDWSGSFSGNVGYTRTFFKASGNFQVGPVPVTVSAEAKGTIGAAAYGTVSSTRISATFAPYTGTSVVGSAGVGNSMIASAGVYTDLDLLTASLPATQQISRTTIAGCAVGLSYKLGVDLVLETLDGAFGLYAEVFGLRYELELARWHGLSTTIPVAGESGTACGA